MALISVPTRVVVLKTMGRNNMTSAQLSVLFVDIFELSNGGKPNMEITPETIELPVGITT